MNVSVYEVSVHQFVLSLQNIKNILKKAETYSKDKNFSTELLLHTRLFPDMFALGQQIQTACDAAKFCASRLSQVSAPKFEDKDESFDELLHRIDKTIEYLNSLTANDFKDFDARKIKFPWKPGKELNGKDYLIQFALPNFYFHISTAYNILRSIGLELGKADFLGQINWQTES
jgi:hypothetical protein